MVEPVNPDLGYKKGRHQFSLENPNEARRAEQRDIDGLCDGPPATPIEGSVACIRIEAFNGQEKGAEILETEIRMLVNCLRKTIEPYFI